MKVSEVTDIVLTDAIGTVPHSAHWGAFRVRRSGGGIEILPHPGDPAPSPLLGNMPAAVRHRPARRPPMIRRGWLEHGPGAGRGGAAATSSCPCRWDEALDLLGDELRRVYGEHGPGAVFGGSYGWASAGRFHHAQSQLHRFLNCLGGYVRSVNSYSSARRGDAAACASGRQEAADPQQRRLGRRSPTHTDVVLAFGGMALKNSDVGGGGIEPAHRSAARCAPRRRAAREFILISPLRDDLPDELGADVASAPARHRRRADARRSRTRWSAEGLHDRAFLDRYCVGWRRLRALPARPRPTAGRRTPRWAAPICGVAGRRRSSRWPAALPASARWSRCWSLQRAEHGEQPVWMGVVLAAMLGQIGLPGGGFGHGSARWP